MNPSRALANIAIGSDQHAGTAVLKDLTGFTGMIFVDPEWKDGANPVSASSHSLIAIPKDGFKGCLVSARNAMSVVGASENEADAAFTKIAIVNGLAWKNAVTAASYEASTIKLNGGSVLIDGSLTDETQAPPAKTTCSRSPRTAC